MHTLALEDCVMKNIINYLFFVTFKTGHVITSKISTLALLRHHHLQRRPQWPQCQNNCFLDYYFFTWLDREDSQLSDGMHTFFQLIRHHKIQNSSEATSLSSKKNGILHFAVNLLGGTPADTGTTASTTETNNDNDAHQIAAVNELLKSHPKKIEMHH